MDRLTILFALLYGLLAPGSRAQAGWVAIRNETNQPIVLQETTVIKNQVRRGKPIKLMPGDVFREYQVAPGSKTVHVLESGGQKRTLFRNELDWQNADTSFVVRQSGTTVTLTTEDAAPTPAIVTKVNKPRK